MELTSQIIKIKSLSLYIPIPTVPKNFSSYFTLWLWKSSGQGFNLQLWQTEVISFPTNLERGGRNTKVIFIYILLD